MGVRRSAACRTTLLLSLAGVIVIPHPALAAARPPLDPELCAPDENSFTRHVDNELFPLPVGRVWVYTGEDEGETLGLRIAVLDRTETFRFGDGRTVNTRVVEETEWADANLDGAIDPDEDLIEVSVNYFAQTRDDTVCYFGEVVDIYEGGEVVSHEGSWRADAPGNAPGIFMPEELERGMTFQQEVAPGVAEDTATVTGTGKASLADGTVVETVTTRDYNPLDGSTGVKVYAEDVGLIQDGPLTLLLRVSG